MASRTASPRATPRRIEDNAPKWLFRGLSLQMAVVTAIVMSGGLHTAATIFIALAVDVGALLFCPYLMLRATSGRPSALGMSSKAISQTLQDQRLVVGQEADPYTGIAVRRELGPRMGL